MDRAKIIHCLQYNRMQLILERGSDYSGVIAIEEAIRFLERENDVIHRIDKIRKELGDLEETMLRGYKY